MVRSKKKTRRRTRFVSRRPGLFQEDQELGAVQPGTTLLVVRCYIVVILVVPG